MVTRFALVLTFIVVVAVLLGSGLRAEPVAQMVQQQDKMHHVLGFFAFAFTLRLAFPRLQVAGLIALSVSVALLIELGQLLLPDRTASLADMTANLLGVGLGWAASKAAQGWWQGHAARGDG